MLVEKILVANRGEIAVRIIKTIQSMGFSAIAVFSDADRFSPHVLLADEAYYLGQSEPHQSYLNIEKIIEAAQALQADAIHPGYGFLSENAQFSKRCQQEQLIFIGPSHQAIELMGSKSKSKAAMLEAKVPCIPGYQGEDQSNDFFTQQAQILGFPVMVKAAAGGGGRGMRVVSSEADLHNALNSARSEAKTGFGNPELILEKAIIGGRHIEIQILADSFGHCLHLGERDCSLQRRHQKVIEEAPSPIARTSLREAMGSAAIKAAQVCNYVGAGTVEFLVDDNENFYFLEMNTRIQVEHPVTELVTGINIVEEQIRVALSEPLRLKQHEIKLKGHAIEARLYAEDPEQNYMPQTGQLLYWQPPQGDGIRCDAGVETGYQISSYYDPMIAKIIAYGDNRNQAIRRLVKALKDTVICGLKTNRDFLIQLLNTDSVREGQFDTTTLQDTQFIHDANEATEAEEVLAIACTIHLAKNLATHNIGSALLSDMHVVYENKLNDYYCNVQVNNNSQEISCTIQIRKKNTPKEKAKEYKTSLWNKDDHKALIGIDNKVCTYHYYFENKNMWICSRDFIQVVTKKEYSIKNTNNQKDGKIYSPMDGRIVKVNKTLGDLVTEGETLAILDAMKIEHPIKSPINGIIMQINVNEGQQVKNKQQIIQLKEA